MSATPSLRAELVAQFKGMPTSVVTDALMRLGVGNWMDGVLPVKSGLHAAGRVRTLLYGPISGIRRTKHAMLVSICADLEPGDVVVVAGGGTTSWITGGNTSDILRRFGAGGLVTDGRTRDVAEIRAMDFAVFSQGVSARPYVTHMELIDFDIPVHCGGAFVRPGDLLVGDDDGIVVTPHEAVEAMLTEAKDILDLEAEELAAIRAGATFEQIQDIVFRRRQRKGPPFPGGKP